jgi:hypothetical protein
MSPSVITILTAASCTTNCLAPWSRSCTNRSESGTARSRRSMRRPTPTSSSTRRTRTCAARARAMLSPAAHDDRQRHGDCGHLSRTQGQAERSRRPRAPVLNASLTDCVFELKRSTSGSRGQCAVCRRLPKARWPEFWATRRGPWCRPTIPTTRAARSSTGSSTMVTDGTLLKVYAWYDNEIGYVCRMVDLPATWKPWVIEAKALDGHVDTPLSDRHQRRTGASRSPTARCACWCCCTSTSSATRRSRWPSCSCCTSSPALWPISAGGWLATRFGIPRMLMTVTAAAHHDHRFCCSRRSIRPGRPLCSPWPGSSLAQGLCRARQGLHQNRVSKSAIKATAGEGTGRLFKWVAWFTGSEKRHEGHGLFHWAA